MKSDLTGFTHLRGIERECLRILTNGDISPSFHPRALGSKLTNSSITVDFSESLLELITQPQASIEHSLKELSDVSTFCVQNMKADEYVLNTSMPLTTAENDIKIADFGSSNSGKMKEIYRRGLALRYGKIMQAIAGIHYNFSFDENLISLRSDELNVDSDQLYFSMINHFFDYMWLIPYLFGASPICAKTSVIEKPDYLEDLDEGYYLGRHATSLRMSDLGYQSSAQDDLWISYKNVASYVKDMVEATNVPYEKYVQLGLYDTQKQLHQLNDSLLQIENEYYSAIRPKQIARRGERPACALLNRGVKYVEVRLLDVDPFIATGVDRVTCHFIEALLMTCLQSPLKDYSCNDRKKSKANLAQIVKQGRKPNLKLSNSENQQVSLVGYAHELLDNISSVAEFMGSEYLQAVELQKKKVDDVSLTPSAQIVAQIGDSYPNWVLTKSKQYSQNFRNNILDKQVEYQLAQQAKDSLLEQEKLEKGDCCDIEAYIEHYYKSVDCAQSL